MENRGKEDKEEDGEEDGEEGAERGTGRRKGRETMKACCQNNLYTSVP